MSNDFMSRRKAQLEKEKLNQTDQNTQPSSKKNVSLSNSHNAFGTNKDPNTQDVINIIQAAKKAGEELQKQKEQSQKDLEFSYDNLSQIVPPPQNQKKEE
jgi:hypothetical protein